MEWEDCVKDVRRGLFLWMMDGEGRVLFGGMFRRSSFDTYICQHTYIIYHIDVQVQEQEQTLKNSFRSNPPSLSTTPFPNPLYPKYDPRLLKSNLSFSCKSSANNSSPTPNNASASSSRPRPCSLSCRSR